MTSTPRFAGLPAGPLATTPVPSLFLSEVLPRIDSLAEAQVSLQVFRLLARKKGSPRYLTTAELLADPATLPPAEPLRYRARMAALNDGFFVEMRELWLGARPVALNQQTFVIIK